MLLLPCLRFADPGRMTDSAFNPQFFHQHQKPLYRSARFNSHPNRTAQCGIKLSYLFSLMFDGLLDQFPCIRVQRRDRLLPCM